MSLWSIHQPVSVLFTETASHGASMIRNVTVALFLLTIFTAPAIFAQHGKKSGHVLGAITKGPFIDLYTR